MECAHCAPVTWEVSSSSDRLQDGPSKGLELCTGNKKTNDLWAYKLHTTWPLPGAGAGHNCWLRVPGRGGGGGLEDRNVCYRGQKGTTSFCHYLLLSQQSVPDHVYPRYPEDLT